MGARKGQQNGTCNTCRHLERSRIELLLAGGASRNAVARKFQLHPDALARHWLRHVTDERKANLVLGPVARMALSAQVAEEAESVIDHYRAVRAGLYQLFESALAAGDRNGGALLAGKLIEAFNGMARITGELANSPLVQINNNNLTVLTESREFLTLQADLIRVLSRFPDARAAVVAEFERLDARNPRPALEHHSAEAPTHQAA